MHIKLVVTRLKEHVASWWYNVQAKRGKHGKSFIEIWVRMIKKMKAKFLSKEYDLSFYKDIHKLKQRMLTVKEYTEEFYRMNSREGYVEHTLEQISWYISALKQEIQDEMSMISHMMMEEAYQFSLKVEHKIIMEKNSSRHHPFYRGKG